MEYHTICVTLILLKKIIYLILKCPHCFLMNKRGFLITDMTGFVKVKSMFFNKY